MRIAVFGLGYVGIVSAACLARDGHVVVGVDPQPAKINLVNEGRSPIVEQYVGELIADAVQRGRLTATRSAGEAVGACDMSLVCVGTPSRRNGSLDTAAVERVCEEIGAAVRAKGAPHLVVIRSTILPGTMRGLVIPALERAADMTTGEVLRVAMNPEFLRELTAVYDYDNPPKTVVGAQSPAIAAEVLAIYEALPGPKIATQLEVAEMVKYADNSWHAVKVAFGNEIGNIAKAVGLDSWVSTAEEKPATGRRNSLPPRGSRTDAGTGRAPWHARSPNSWRVPRRVGLKGQPGCLRQALAGGFRVRLWASR